MIAPLVTVSQSRSNGDGKVQEHKTVTNGAITLDEAASTIHVGLPYVSDLEMLDFSAGDVDMRGRPHQVSKVHVTVLNSRGLWIGPTVDKLKEVFQRQDEHYDDPIALKSETFTKNINPVWKKEGSLYMRQVDPLPMTLLAVTPEVMIGG